MPFIITHTFRSEEIVNEGEKEEEKEKQILT